MAMCCVGMGVDQMLAWPIAQLVVLDTATGRYDAQATPSTGSHTLVDFHAAMLRGEAAVERGDHAVF